MAQKFLNGIVSEGNITTDSKVIAGSGDGSVALTVNDGGGNANLTFNHADQTPDKSGNSFRIRANVDSSSGPAMLFELKEGVTAGTQVSTLERFRIDNTGVKVRNPSSGILDLQRDDTSVVGSNALGKLRFMADDPTNGSFNIGAEIKAKAEAAWDTDSYPSRLEFYTTTTDTSILALTIDKDQDATFAGNVSLTGGTSKKLSITASQHDTNTANTSTLELGFGHSGGTGVGNIVLTEDANNSFGADMTFGVPHNNGSGGSSTRTALTLDGGTLSATFAGDITTSGNIILSGAANEIIKSNGSIRLNIDSDNNQGDRVFIVSHHSNTELFKVDEGGHGTFAGAVNAITTSGHQFLLGNSNNTSTADTSGFRMLHSATYDDGRYAHRFRKYDHGGGIPLYIDGSGSTANIFTALARFGTYSGEDKHFEVFGKAKATHFYGDGSNLTGVTVSNADTVDNLHASAFLQAGGSWNGANMPGSRYVGLAVNGGEVVFQRDNPNTSQMSILVDGAFYAGENNGFYSLYSGNSYNSKAGFYADTSGVLQFNAAATFAGDVTVNGGDFNLTKQNGSPVITMLHDGNNPAANTLLHHLDFKVDYAGNDASWGGIEHRTTTSGTRTKLNFNVKSTGGNVMNALSLEGTNSGPNATFAGNVTLNSRLTFDYGGDHYFEAGTNSLAYKSSGGTAVMTLNASTLAATFAGQVNVPERIHIGGATSGTKTLSFESTTNAQVYNIDFYNNVGAVQGRISYAEGAGSISLSPNIGATAALDLAYNGDATFAGTNATFAGSINVNTNGLIKYEENTDVDSSAAEAVASVVHGTHTAAFFDYVIKKGANVRSGIVTACHDGTNVEYAETSTVDLGDTSDVVLSVDISGVYMRLIATAASNDWIVKSLIRAI